MNIDPANHDEQLKKAERIAYLIAGHLNGTLSEKEKDELDEWIVESDENLALFEKLTDEDNVETAMQQFRHMEQQKAHAFEKVKDKIRQREKKSLPARIWPYLAAACLVLVVISTFLLRRGVPQKDIEKPLVLHPENKMDIKAGSDKAVLTLSDGRTIILDSSGSGLLASEGAINIRKSAEGEIIYNGTDTQMNYNRVSTPRGGQYKLILGDGTKVWLNAESSLKFPAGIAKVQREVELSGEGYFEVAKDPTRPFKVKITTPLGDGGRVEVLGTHFNINSYSDEGMVKATLVEGLVKVEKNGSSKLLYPGEQALMAKNISVEKADVKEVLSWKNGVFRFRNETIETIGEQIRRWYDVDVVHRGKITQHFNMEISRNEPLSRMLQLLERTGQVHFVLEGRKLTIKP